MILQSKKRAINAEKFYKNFSKSVARSLNDESPSKPKNETRFNTESLIHELRKKESSFINK